MVKARIAPGYPKLAQYIGKQARVNYFPTHARDYGSHIYTTQPGDLVVLANQSWRGSTWYHYVPIKLLEDGNVPLTSILTWTQAYGRLPRIEATLLKIWENTDALAL